jgi:hypothetical protein
VGLYVILSRSNKQMQNLLRTQLNTPVRTISLRAIGHLAWRMLGFALLMAMLGSCTIPASLARRYAFDMAVTGYKWDLVSWEVSALWEKFIAFVEQPADDVPPLEAVQLVQEYMARSARIGEIEFELARRASLPPSEPHVPPDTELKAEMEDLQRLQANVRPQVEQIIELQVSSVLSQEGFTNWMGRIWPPVSFTFVEPPKKLVVSRRDLIETIYSKMLAAELRLTAIEDIEGEIDQQRNASAYVTEIGGLGAYPTIVVDDASLGWVLSTVAHEWTHNYLVFHPLGWYYFSSQDLTTINETVADIVGNEIGDRVLMQYYPELVPTDEPDSPPSTPDPPSFDFQLEMQITRQQVDRLLAEGEVEEAEAYMEARRLQFVANGYPLRVLNQAYFAFHGSYGTSPASTSPIGPKLERLRALAPDLTTFLDMVRRFTSVDDLDRTLSEWESVGDISHSIRQPSRELQLAIP